MDRNITFQPNWSSAPGETILDTLRELGLSESAFSDQMSLSSRETSDLVEGRATITIGLARKLSSTLGASVEFWMSRDHHYRQDATRLREEERNWVRGLPLGDMIKFGWITPPPLPEEEFKVCLDFFGVSSVREWSEHYFDQVEMATFKTSPAFASNRGADAAWLRQGEIEAQRIECRPWNPEGFLESLSDIRKLTRRKEPAEFLPVLRQICANNGVAAVVVRAPNGCRASGATRFITPEKAILQLSFRYLSDDHFWFTVVHEAGHLLFHGARRYFASGLDNQKSWILEGGDVIQREEEEREANEFATSILIPVEHQDELASLPSHHRSVVRFAQKIGVSPGIVVGQLQYAKLIGYNELNKLKRRYEWDR